MNLRTKSVGLLAGAIFALGSVLGVTAQDAVDTTATLLTNSDYACYGSVALADRNFGEFVWGAGGYTGAMAGTFTIEATQEISPLDTDCDFTINGTDLVLDVSNVISAAEIALTSGTENPDPNPFLNSGDSFTVVDVKTGAVATTHDIGYDLSGAIDEQAPGEYRGTITVTAVDPTATP